MFTSDWSELRFRDLEAFAKKENAERRRETEDINLQLQAENEKRIKEAQALKEKIDKENREMQVRIQSASISVHFNSQDASNWSWIINISLNRISF